jgi:hypothetical protein
MGGAGLRGKNKPSDVKEQVPDASKGGKSLFFDFFARAPADGAE